MLFGQVGQDSTTENEVQTLREDADCVCVRERLGDLELVIHIYWGLQ